MLNARGHFAAPMWTPVINNIVVIAVLLLFIVTGGIGASAASITPGQVQLLGFGTTLGIIAQTAALIPFLRRVGFRWHPRFDFRRAEVTEIRRMAGPLFGYILTTQVAFLVVQNVANAASNHASYDGFPAYSYAWQLFQLPYADRGHLGDHRPAAADERPRVGEELRAGEERLLRRRPAVVGHRRARRSASWPCSAPALAEALFGYGSTSVAEARYIGLVFGVFSLGLVPYMMFQLMLRVFYAMHDSRTPMYIGVAVMATNIAFSLLALAVLPAGHVVEGVAAAFGLANVVGTVISWRILSRRLHGLAGQQIASSLVRMHLAAIPGLFFALAASLMVGVILAPGPAFGIVTVIIGGSGALLLYLLFAKALGITEVTELTSGLRTRLGRLPGREPSWPGSKPPARASPGSGPPSAARLLNAAPSCYWASARLLGHCPVEPLTCH